ncbi:hypothetical protein CI109_103803 [Kwoniella shandongensis]|uniref:Uncharacterized protein n=1 Tax=Kwoniella shandongensis TaxID=1734106 RepID=A0A5M6CAY7_9TREE|nr:uncharacterized protein CI109_000503 [Kwoniella shandongensis]KAA5530932.1 hypothetical protein CI109_000503 [Kwoniella shandongensis]
MGSSISQPSRPSSTPSSTAPDTSNRPPPINTYAPIPRPASTLSRLSSIRRLSSFGRSTSDNATKRVRQGSSSTISDTPVMSRSEKKQKRGEGSESGSTTPTPISTAASSSMTPMVAREGGSSMQISTRPPSPVQEDDPMDGTSLSPLTYPQPTLPSLSLPLPASSLTSPLASDLPSPSEDPLIEDRLRSLSTIREALGPEWLNSNAATTPAVERLMHRFRRSSSFPTLSDQNQPTNPTRTMSDRLTALLGFSSPGEHPSTASEQPNQPLPTSTGSAEAETDSAPTPNTLEELTQRLEQAREDLAQTEQQLNAARETAERARRVPAGAVLVIQGLAQTHTHPSEGESSNGRSSQTPRSRRSSEGSASTGPSQQQQQSEESSSTSLDTQARMIGGLLTVAAAATASTLLAPNRPAPTPAPPRTPAASTLETIVNRLRPNRPRGPQSVEAALGNYLRNVMQDNRQSAAAAGTAGGPTPTAAESTESHISDEFQRFLEGLQGDLVGAVRAFAAPPIEGISPDADSPRTATEGTATPQQSIPQEEVAEPVSRPEPNGSEAGPSNSTSSDDSNLAVPSFHYQPGQNAGPINGQAPEITGGTDGVPRRLNFFRAHIFPPVSAFDSDPTPAEDANAMVPCIFIGVRSIRHDPNMTTDDLVQHPSFPFVDGQVPPAASAQSPSSTAVDQSQIESAVPATSPIPPPSPALAPTPTSTSTSTSERRSLRDRFFDRLNPRREHFQPPPQGPLNTYLVYVIGGNYPRSHPILSIPNLVTGGPLTDEEMALVSELMGPAKPPTVERAEIEKSGLRIVRGGDMKTLRDKEEVLESCVDRCLICLSEYEEEDECRILNCRHGYHKECVDQWLSTGRNSCPACRSEAVDTNKGNTRTSGGGSTLESGAGGTASQGLPTSAGPPVQAE